MIRNFHEAVGVAWHILKEYSNAELYIVGGAVRDWFAFGKEPSEIDFVTNLKPDQLLAIFPAADVVGKSFGVVKAGVCRGPGIPFVDVATYRRDCYSADMVHTKGCEAIEFAASLEEDLSRRDFTFNAMALPVKDHNRIHQWDFTLADLIDPFGGYNDLHKRQVRFVGNAAERISEDPCRLLRGCRFTGLFPDGAFGKNTEINIRIDAKKVDLCAKERIHDELMKCMHLPHPEQAIWWMVRVGLMARFFPELADCRSVTQNKYHVDDVLQHCLLSMKSVNPKYPLIRFAALVHDIGKPPTKALHADGEIHFFDHEQRGADILAHRLQQLKFSNEEIRYICEMVYRHMFFFEKITKLATYRRFMAKLKVPVRDLLRLRIADRKGNRAKQNRPLITHAFRRTLRVIRHIESEKYALTLKDVHMNGTMLKAMGIVPGPIYTEILNSCFNLVLAHPWTNRAWLLKLYVYSNHWYGSSVFESRKRI